jgi:hypothetical protein
VGALGAVVVGEVEVDVDVDAVAGGDVEVAARRRVAVAVFALLLFAVARVGMVVVGMAGFVIVVGGSDAPTCRVVVLRDECAASVDDGEGKPTRRIVIASANTAMTQDLEVGRGRARSIPRPITPHRHDPPTS